MMKRPRSFISTLLIFFCLATVSLGLTTYAARADASATPRLIDPRAGDPSEPSDGLADSGNSATTPGESDPIALKAPVPAKTKAAADWSWLLVTRAFSSLFLRNERR